MSAEKNSPSTQTLAAALRALTPASPAMAGLAKRMVAAQQPVIDQKASLSKAMAAISSAQQTQTALSKIFAGDSQIIRKITEQTGSGGLVSDATKQQMVQAAQLATPWSKETKMVANSLSHTYAPFAQAAARARMSPVFGGTFQPPSAQPTQLVRQPAVLGLVSPLKAIRPKMAPARLPVIHNRLLDPKPPTLQRQREIVRPVAPAPAPATPQVLPQELAELFAQHLTRADRQDAEGLLVIIDLDLELEHLRAIERCLSSGTRPDRLHAALSASQLLKGLANHLFPPQEEMVECRFGGQHEVGPKDVSNRLSAFVDSRLRSELSTREHKLFQSTLDSVFRWSGEGHHVVFSPRETAEAFCRLLKVLAVIARAHQVARC